jgi:hypothetical protein
MAVPLPPAASERLFRLVVILVVVHALSYTLLHGQAIDPRSSVADEINRCDFCLASQGISPLEIGASGVRVDIRYLRVGTPFLDGTKAENPEQELETHLTQQYSLFYALSSRFTLAGFVPLSKRHSEHVTEAGDLVTGNQFGVADIMLLLRYKALVEHDGESTSIISFAAGTKLATGRTDGKDSHGDLLDAHMLLGTGSTDVVGGVSGFLAWDRVALILNLLGSVTTGGANGHRFGNSMNYDLTARYRFYPAEFEETQFFLTLGVNGELRGKEKQDGTEDDDSGGNVLYVTPGIQVFFSPAVSFDASFQYPAVHALHGLQLGEEYRIAGGIQVLLQ